MNGRKARALRGTVIDLPESPEEWLERTKDGPIVPLPRLAIAGRLIETHAGPNRRARRAVAAGQRRRVWKLARALAAAARRPRPQPADAPAAA